VFTSEKIEEWIKEVEERPSSAPIVIQFIASRLRDLTEWNEKLRAENIVLRTGKRVEEYERQIAHLQYQLDLIKRQYGGELPEADQILTAEPVTTSETLSLLIYGIDGRVLHLELDSNSLEDGSTIGNLGGLPLSEEPPRLLVVPSKEELLFVFASGRIATTPVVGLPIHLLRVDESIDWEQVSIPNPPQSGDTLACIVPVSKMALADYFIQTSRRGYMKKIRMALAPSIMENQYIGRGAKLPADETLDLGLSGDQDRFVLVSQEGYLRYVPIDLLPYAVVEAIHLNSTDHLVSAFPMQAEKSVLVITQIGKTIHRTEDSLELVTDLERVGKALYSKSRREAGIRVVGAAAVAESDWGLALQSEGQISLHAVSELFSRGTIPVEGELITFVTFEI
jgi:DNA gyrase/topoisomerase IV subunit A